MKVRIIGFYFLLCFLFSASVYAVDPMPVPRNSVPASPAVVTATPQPMPTLPRVTVAPVAPANATATPMVSPRPMAARQIIFFGDSISQFTGYADETCAALRCVRVNQNLPGLNYANAAVAGGSLIHIDDAWCTNVFPCAVDTYSTRVAPYQFDRMVIEFGTNDIYNAIGTLAYPNHDTLGAWGDSWDALYRQMSASAIHSSIVLGLPYITGHKGFTPLATTEATSWQDLANKMDAITALKASQYGAKYVPLNMTPDMISDDGVHPNAYGYQYMADLCIAAMV